MYFAGSLGRKTCIVLALCGQSIAFSGLVIMDITKWYGLLYPTCFVYIMCFAMGASIAAPWMVETIPSVGIGLALGLQSLITGLVGMFVPLMNDDWIGSTGTMIFFGTWCWIGIFAMDYVVIETKGKQTDEIEKEYMNFKYKLWSICPKRKVKV
jgi:hypothetical protein